jgi:type IV pilus assembly protein PilO
MSVNNSATKTPSKATKYTFEDFQNSFKSLDPQNMGNWPLPVKITMCIMIFAVVLAIAYFALINPLRDEIAAAESRETTLLADYREKDSKVRNLLQYQKQITDMESTFGQLLQQLPKVTEIPGLVEDINYTGVGSGLHFDKIDVQKEATKDFFIELPIQITGRGDYHSFGAFVSSLAALPRIVTVDDFTIRPLPDSKSEIPVLSLIVNAKTYRYNDKADKAGAKPAAAAAGSAS